MSSPTHEHKTAEQGWTNYATERTPAPGEPQDPSGHHADSHGGGTGHGGHRWMMLLMCAPLVLIGIWALVSGAGGGALIGGLLCMGMMAFMHLGMGGKGHRH
ncbi:MAG: hypothetical protein LCH76_10950 [Actinobacteria bacterium]|nr:hypothetical protein [Actinomycetota bacterium]